MSNILMSTYNILVQQESHILDTDKRCIRLIEIPIENSSYSDIITFFKNKSFILKLNTNEIVIVMNENDILSHYNNIKTIGVYTEVVGKNDPKLLMEKIHNHFC